MDPDHAPPTDVRDPDCPKYGRLLRYRIDGIHSNAWRLLRNPGSAVVSRRQRPTPAVVGTARSHMRRVFGPGSAVRPPRRPLSIVRSVTRLTPGCKVSFRSKSVERAQTNTVSALCLFPSHVPPLSDVPSISRIVLNDARRRHNMIILESDWDEAAGVAQEAEEGRDEDASSSRPSVLPRCATIWSLTL